MTAAIDVVILTWNDADDARRAVDSSLASEGVKVKVIVVDNGSTPAFVGPADSRVTVIRSPENLGVGGGRNLGSEATTAPYLCFLDSDATLSPTCLAELVESMERDPAVGVVGPVFADQEPEVGAGAAPTPGRKVARGLGLTDRYRRMRPEGADEWEVEFVIGACQVARREALVEVGGMDDSARFGPEDVDFCLRVRRRGWRVHQSALAVCEHVARRSSRRLLSRSGLAHLRAVVRHHRTWRRLGRC